MPPGFYCGITADKGCAYCPASLSISILQILIERWYCYGNEQRKGNARTGCEQHAGLCRADRRNGEGGPFTEDYPGAPGQLSRRRHRERGAAAGADRQDAAVPGDGAGQAGGRVRIHRTGACGGISGAGGHLKGCPHNREDGERRRGRCAEGIPEGQEKSGHRASGR